MKGLSRYAAVGAVATACHYALLVVLVEAAGVVPGLSALAGAVLGGVVAYLGNRRYTFSFSEVGHARAMPRFAAVAAAGAVLNGLIVGAGAALGVHYLLAQVLATVLVMLATYQLNRIWTFDSRH